MAFGDFKGLPWITALDKILCDETLLIEIKNKMVIKEVLLQWFRIF